MVETGPQFKTDSARALLFLLFLFFVGVSASCRRSDSAPGPIFAPQEFEGISNGTATTPRLIDGHAKDIQLEVYEPHFDGSRIESRKMSSAEWKRLRAVLKNGIEAKNVRLLALSAWLRFFDDDGKVIFGLPMYWTSQSGDVYIQSGEKWFRVPDRKAVLEALRAQS